MRPPVPKPKKRLAALRARHQLAVAATAELRRLVMARSRGHCEGCGHFYGTMVLQLDHWLGGSGRRRQAQAIANCWGLCPGCHSRRSQNLPDSAHWNRLFSRHCVRRGYHVLNHVEHDPVRRGA